MLRAIRPAALNLIAICVIASLPFSIRAAVDADEQKNAVAYDSVNNRFLVVYAEFDPVDIYGSLLGGDGELLLPSFPIANAPYKQLKPVVAYSPVTETYLVVWLDHRADDVSGIDIYGQRISSEGVLLGENFLISTSGGNERRPAVAYDSVNDRFLVTWSAFPQGRNYAANVLGRIVSSDGSFVGRQFKIGIGPKEQFKPALSFDPSTESYLVVWQDRRDEITSRDDIWGQVVSADGGLLGDPIRISALPESEWRPDVAYDTQRQRHLVVWMRRNGELADLYGQFVTGGGALSGPAFVITDDEGGEVKPAVGYAGQQDLFLVAYMKNGVPEISGADIHGRFVSGDGEPLEHPVFISQGKNVQHRPDIAAKGNLFFVIWTDFRYMSGGDESQYEVMGRIVAPEVLTTERLAP